MPHFHSRDSCQGDDAPWPLCLCPERWKEAVISPISVALQSSSDARREVCRGNQIKVRVNKPWCMSLGGAADFSVKRVLSFPLLWLQMAWSTLQCRTPSTASSSSTNTRTILKRNECHNCVDREFWVLRFLYFFLESKQAKWGLSHSVRCNTYK